MLTRLDPRARIDLHLHTTRSDGAFAPGEVLRRCAEGGLDVVALTDHDLATDIPPGEHEVAGRRIRVVAGAELTASHAGREFHLLVYFPGEVPRGFRDFCRAQCVRRAARYQAARRNLGVEGLPEPDDDALAGRRALTRLHLARALVDLGHAAHLSDAFATHLSDAAGRVPPLGLAMVDAIRTARAHGGLTSWAHPPLDAAEAHLPALAAAGLHGIEALRPGLPGRERRRLCRLARRHGLFVTGGSDWHGWRGERVGLFRLSPRDLGGFAESLDAAA